MATEFPPCGRLITIDQEATDDPVLIKGRLGNAVVVLSSRELSPGRLVKLRTATGLSLGEVSACEPISAGFLIRLEIEHCIDDLLGLIRTIHPSWYPCRHPSDSAREAIA